MNCYAARQDWIMVFWRSATALREAKTSGSLRTVGARNGAIRDTLECPEIRRITVVLQQLLLIQSSKKSIWFEIDSKKSIMF